MTLVYKVKATIYAVLFLPNTVLCIFISPIACLKFCSVLPFSLRDGEFSYHSFELHF